MSRKPRTITSIATSAVAVLAVGIAPALVADSAVAQPHIANPTEVNETGIAYSAGAKTVDAGTNAWGRFPLPTSRAAGDVQVRTEVLINGKWSTSQRGTLDHTGNFVLPLTYGSTTPGIYTFRVRAIYPDGSEAVSNEIQLERLARPTAHTAGTKPVHQGTNTWGRFDTDKATTAWTEVQINGKWSRSQTTKTDGNGNFVIPLTYGTTSPGTYTFRVRGSNPDGTIVASKEFDLRRLAPPTAYSAGTKKVGESTNAWGRFDTTSAMTVWTEVLVNGTWSRSQTGKTDAKGNYVLPLTYGSTTPGTYTFRVRGTNPDGSTSTSSQITLTRVADKSKAEQAVAFAESRIGDGYRYGGTGPTSWDCSGLTAGAWKAAGVSLPRTSQQQYAAGKKVAKSDLQPGDLVFYYSARSHVAIYVGDGKIVHASRPGQPVSKVSVDLMPYNGAVRPA